MEPRNTGNEAFRELSTYPKKAVATLPKLKRNAKVRFEEKLQKQILRQKD